MTVCNFGEEEIEFPVEVHFRIVCVSELKVSTHVMIAAEELGLGENLVAGNESSGGKYLSYQLSTVVNSKEEMNKIDQTFRAVEGVKMVL
ncbi:DUF493 domain-containing protein [Kiritimatiellaeota bacterium B1221]|nr:DUF493 domain-containing protein [Kiritimatiellaeota bacterium B1221]